MSSGAESRTAQSPSLIDLRWLALATAVVATVEMVLLRVLTRTVIHIPGLDWFRSPYRIVTEAGRFALYLAAVLLVVLMVVVAVRAWDRGGRPVTVVLLGFLVVAAGVRLGIVGETISGAATAVLVLAAVAAPPGWNTARRLPLIAMAVAFAITAAVDVLGSAAPGVSLPTAALIQGSEALALLGATSLALLAPRPAVRRAVLAGVAVAVLVAAALMRAEATTEILLLWNLGVAGYFHPLFYAAACGALTYAGVRSHLAGDDAAVAGVLLVLAGGIGLHSTLQSGELIMGLSLLTFPSLFRGPVNP